PKARDNVNIKNSTENVKELARNRQVGHRNVLCETKLTQQVKSPGAENHDPKYQENVPVEQIPVIGHVYRGKEFQGESQFQESETHFDRIQPSAGLGQRLQPLGENCKQGKGDGQGQGEAEHARGGTKQGALAGGLYQERPDDGPSAGERGQAKRHRHKENTGQSMTVCFLVGERGPGAGQVQFKCAKEGNGKNDQYQEKQDIQKSVAGQFI